MILLVALVAWRTPEGGNRRLGRRHVDTDIDADADCEAHANATTNGGSESSSLLALSRRAAIGML